MRASSSKGAISDSSYDLIWVLMRQKPILTFVFFGLAVGATLFEGLGIALLMPLLEASSNAPETVSNSETLIEMFFVRTDLHPSTRNILLAMIAAFVLKGIMQFGAVKLRVEHMARFSLLVRTKFLDCLENLSLDFFDRTKKDSLSALISAEVPGSSLAVLAFLNVMVRTLTACTFIILSLHLNWQLAALALTIFALVGSVMRFVSERSSAESRKLSRFNLVFNRRVIQAISAFKYLKGTSSFGYIRQKSKVHLEEISNSQSKIGLYAATLDGVQQPIVAIILATLVYFSVEVLGQDIASVFVILALTYKVISQLIGLQGEWQNFSSNRGNLEILSSALDRMKQFREPNGSRPYVGFQDSICFENVSLSIQSNPVLKGVDLNIPKGKFIGIVGVSGSGKSTLIDMILGLRRPTSGQVLVDGVSLAEFDSRSWRKSIGLVNQEFSIFSDGLIESVAVPDAILQSTDLSRIEKALKTAHAWDFCGRALQGDASQSDHFQENLSVGQRQRISIARAVFREPSLLILDEATSALDPVSESNVQAAIDQLSKQNTTVLITHRLSNLQNCDLIYVMESGRIVESGSIEELMRLPQGYLRELSNQGLLT